MTKGFSVASCASQQSARFLWVSDALLKDTFNRFCHHHKRYGSNVPGPLEAQRRAAKRRNTSLAYASHGGIFTDPSILLGNTSKINWWQSPTTDPARTGTRTAPSDILPSWLFPSLAPTPSPSNKPATSFPSKDNNARDLATQLSQCKCLADIRKWLQESGLDLREDLDTGSLIPKHILTVKLKSTEIAAYMCDPRFHPVGTSFIRQLIPGLLGHVWSTQAWGNLSGAICSAVELGLLSVDDVRAIINEVASSATVIRLRTTGGERVEVTASKSKLITDCLKSLERSKVLALSDLGKEFLSELVSTLNNLNGFRYKSDIKALWQLLPWASEANLPIITKLTLHFLRGGQNDAQAPFGDQLAQRLAMAEPKVLRRVLLDVTEAILSLSLTSETMLYRFLYYHWASTLAILGSSRYGVSLTKDSWLSRGQSCESESKSELTSDQRLLAFSWTAMTLGGSLRKSPVLSERVVFLDQFARLLLSIPAVTPEFLDRAVVGLHNSPLPSRHALLRNLAMLPVWKADNAPQPEDDVKLAIDNVLQQGYARGDIQEFAEDFSSEKLDAFAELIESLNHNLALFKILSRRVIQKSSSSFGLVCRLLEENVAFKRALESASFSAPQQRDKSRLDGLDEVEAAAHQGGSRESPLTESRGARPPPPSAHDVVDVINHIAVSFATSPVATPRASLSRVYWCYLFLRRHTDGRAVPPTITRALWHVGVTRYGDKGTAATLLKWIMRQVAQTEGVHVSQRLLWSENFRQMRRKELERLSRIDDAEEAGLLAALDEEDDKRRAPTLAAACRAGDWTTLVAQQQLDDDEATTPNADHPRSKDLLRESAGVLERRIDFLLTEPPERPFWFEKPERIKDWNAAVARREKRQAKHLERRGNTITAGPATSIGGGNDDANGSVVVKKRKEFAQRWKKTYGRGTSNQNAAAAATPTTGLSTSGARISYYTPGDLNQEPSKQEDTTSSYQGPRISYYVPSDSNDGISNSRNQGPKELEAKIQ